MPLQKLRLRNFQAHASLTVEFDKEVTTLIGKSDIGKSSILRALRWVIFNRPSGSAFLRYGKKFVSVLLSVDGHRIKRKKGAANTYSLDGKVFAAFGSQKVPKDVSDLLNVGEVSYQGQHDAYFWVSNTPGELSKQLNKIINLEVIDSSLAQVASELRKAKLRVEVSRERLKAAKAQKQELAWVPEFCDKLGKIEKFDAAIAARRTRIASLASLIEEWEKGRLFRRNALPLIQSGLAALKLAERAAKTTDRVKRLQSLIHEIETTRTKTCDLKQALADAEQEFHQKTAGQNCPTCGQTM